MNKYGAKKQVYNGITYDSKKEAKYAAELDWLIKAKEIEKVQRQVKIPLMVNGFLICNYIIDFKITFTDGREEYHEVKGYPTPDWKLKFKLVQALYPDWVFVVIK